MIYYQPIPDYVPEKIKERFKDCKEIPFLKEDENGIITYNDKDNYKLLMQDMREKYGYDTDDLLQFNKQSIEHLMGFIDFYNNYNGNLNEINLEKILEDFNILKKKYEDWKFEKTVIKPNITFKVSALFDILEDYQNSWKYKCNFDNERSIFDVLNNLTFNVKGIRHETDEEQKNRLSHFMAKKERDYNRKQNEKEKKLKQKNQKIKEIRITPEQMEATIKRAEEVVKNSASWKDVKPTKRDNN